MSAAGLGDIGGIRAAVAAGGTNLRGGFLAAVREGHDLAAIYMLGLGVRADDPSLVAAAMLADRPQVVQALVEKGADPNRDRLPECAAELGREELAQWLLARGAGQERPRASPRLGALAWLRLKYRD